MAMSFTRGSFLSLSSGGFHRIAYADWGKHSASQVVVCVHGLSRNCRDFDYLARELARSCRVVCPDVVGRGDSEWLADKSDYSFSTYLSDAAALIARITAPAPPVHMGILRGTILGARKYGDGPAQIDWVGTSMGGLIGMLLAAKRGSPIRRLVLNDVGAFISWGSLYRLKGYVAGGGAFKSAAEVEAYLRDACAPSAAHRRTMAPLAEHSAAAGDDGRFHLRYDPAIGDTMRVNSPDPELPLGPNFLAGIDLWSTWAEVRCPTLVLRGAESDVLSRDTLARMRALRPDTEVLELPGIGHAPALMSYDQISAVREFLLR
jgi:pimeloyl-ACP methyl ester carboxylesterase